MVKLGQASVSNLDFLFISIPFQFCVIEDETSIRVVHNVSSKQNPYYAPKREGKKMKVIPFEFGLIKKKKKKH